jgi:arylformamidase
MLVQVQINGENYQVDAQNPLDIAIPLRFNGAQPNAYGVERAASKAYQAGDLIGDTRRGGSCNFEQYKFIPHCNGTHTECVGHITHQRISIRESLKDAFIPVTLITVQPRGDEKLITKEMLAAALSSTDKNWLGGLVVRTLPNDESKQTRVYLEEIPPYFSREAMEYIVELEIKHLLADIPSIDRLFDEGKLINHRLFWNIETGIFEVNPNTETNKTVTEMIFVPDSIADGKYLLNLQIAPFVADVSPSRPILFQVK